MQYSLIEMAVGAEVNGKLVHESEHRGQSAADFDETEPVGAVNLVGE